MSRRVMPELVDPGDAGRHLVDQALHPEPGQPQVVGTDGSSRRRRRALGDGRRRAVAAAGRGQDLVAQADELGPLLGEHGRGSPSSSGTAALAASRS